LDNYLFFTCLLAEQRDSQDMYSRPPIFTFCTIAGEAEMRRAGTWLDA
jgi:hypothetical protein